MLPVSSVAKRDLIMANEVCFATLQFDQPWTLENYLKVGGYKAWKKILAEKTAPEKLVISTTPAGG